MKQEKQKEQQPAKEETQAQKPVEEQKVDDKSKEKQFVWKEGVLKPGYQRPVIVHRAIMGSIERFFAIICEEYGGKWPFWISPRQLSICTINDQCVEFA